MTQTGTWPILQSEVVLAWWNGPSAGPSSSASAPSTGSNASRASAAWPSPAPEPSSASSPPSATSVPDGGGPGAAAVNQRIIDLLA
jgi:hypothetical protein